MKKILAVLLSLTLLMSLSACEDNTNKVPPSSTQAITFRQTGDQKAPAISTEHFSFNRGEVTYLYAVAYTAFLNDYYSYLSHFGLDITKSFKDQDCSVTDGGSWFDFFMNEAKNYASNYLVFCEAARELGLELDQEDKDFIAREKKLLEEEAAAYGWDMNTYLSQLYSTNIEWEYIAGTYEKMRLAQKAYNRLVAEREFTDEELETEYQAHRSNYDLIDYYSVFLGDGENLPEDLIKECRSAMEKVSSLEEYREVVKSFLGRVKDTNDIEAAGGIDAYTDKYLKEHLKEGQSYLDNEFYQWAHGEEAEEGKVFLVESTTQAPYAYCLVKKPYRDEGMMVNVRHILFMLSSFGGSYETMEGARQRAEEVLAEWKTAGGTETVFSEFASRYTEDSGSAANGGLYTGVKQGQMVQAFNDWCFDPARKSGDYGIVETEYGAHVMYFVDGGIAWKIQADSSLFSSFYDQTLRELTEKYPVTNRDDVLSAINW